MKLHQTDKELVHKVTNLYATYNSDFFLILLISSKQPETAGPHNAENVGYAPFVYVFYMYLS